MILRPTTVTLFSTALPVPPLVILRVALFTFASRAFLPVPLEKTTLLICASFAPMRTLPASERDLLDRHHSLRAVFDYSWRLMNTAERDALMQPAIFAVALPVRQRKQ